MQIRKFDTMNSYAYLPRNRNRGKHTHIRTGKKTASTRHQSRHSHAVFCVCVAEKRATRCCAMFFFLSKRADRVYFFFEFISYLQSALHSAWPAAGSLPRQRGGVPPSTPLSPRIRKRVDGCEERGERTDVSIIPPLPLTPAVTVYLSIVYPWPLVVLDSGRFLCHVIVRVMLCRLPLWRPC